MVRRWQRNESNGQTRSPPSVLQLDLRRGWNSVPGALDEEVGPDKRLGLALKVDHEGWFRCGARETSADDVDTRGFRRTRHTFSGRVDQHGLGRRPPGSGWQRQSEFSLRGTQISEHAAYSID